ncbi:MAG: hypothetical protein RR967_04790 [Anaerovoracaceae bacterium]
MENLKGKNIIKISGILLAIIGILSIAGNIGSMVGMEIPGFGKLFLIGSTKVTQIGGIVYGLIGLLAGQFAIKHCGHIDAAPGIVTRGILVFIIGIIIMIIEAVTVTMNPLGLLCLIVPLLMMLGGTLNK